MKKIFTFSAFSITSITFIIIWLFSFIPFKLGILNPIKKAVNDFDIYDIVFSQIREDQKFDPDIILVNIGNQNRAKIARQISILSKFDPKVIGLDVLFEQAKDKHSDSLLCSVIKNTPKVVLVSKVEGYNEVNDNYNFNITSFNPLSEYAMHGFANFPEDDRGAFRTIRTFRPKVKYYGAEISSFAVKIAETFDPLAASSLFNRNNEIETINYRGNSEKFYTIDFDQFEDSTINLSFVRNKIVLMGYMGDNILRYNLEDIFFSPLNKTYIGRTFPDMYGIVIHANIISMILHGNYINQVPQWIRYLFIALITYLNSALILFVKKRWKDWYGGITNLILFAQTILNLLFSLIIFIFFNLKINVTLGIVSVVLIPTSIDLYNNYLIHIKKAAALKIDPIKNAYRISKTKFNIREN